MDPHKSKQSTVFNGPLKRDFTNIEGKDTLIISTSEESMKRCHGLVDNDVRSEDHVANSLTLGTNMQHKATVALRLTLKHIVMIL